MLMILSNGLDGLGASSGQPVVEAVECGGKRSAPPLWLSGLTEGKRCRRFALPPHSKSLNETGGRCWGWGMAQKSQTSAPAATANFCVRASMSKGEIKIKLSVPATG